MKKFFFLGTILLILAQCRPGDPAVQKTPAAELSNQQIFRGSLKMGLTAGLLSDCSTGKQYVITQKASLDSLYRQACGPIIYPEKTVYAVLRGQLNTDTLSTSDVDAIEAKNAWNTCVPFEFWCSGTEPFWELEISQAEGGLFLEDMAQQQGAKYTWAAPVVEGDTWTYAAPAISSTQPALRVVVKKEQANNGMSEVVYNYSAELIVGAEKRKGVAVRWGEPKMVPKGKGH